MSAKLKTKITLGVVFLFTLLLLVGAAGLFYLDKTITGQRDILKDNYETIGYTKNMLQALDSAGGMAAFQENLRAQEANITEPGEAAATAALRKHLDQFNSSPESAELKNVLRNDINRIMQINLGAIIEKNRMVGKNAEDARFIITMLLTICALVGFTFVYNFPGYIAGPVTRLTKGIKGIAAKNYSERIHLNRNDEFGEMASAFNHMAEELDRYEHSNLAKIMFEKKRAETVINSLKDASIGIDRNGTVLFANTRALQLLNLSETDMIGKSSEALAQKNDLFRFLWGNESDQPFRIVVNDKEQFFSKETIDISDAEGSIGNMIALKNITPYKELDVAKTNFIATVSHELKTPLASSDFSLKLLEDSRIGSLNEEQKELVKSLKADNQRLLKILSELLDLSQVESGKMQLHITEVDPSAPVRRAVAAVEAAAHEKQIQVAATIAQGLPNIRADEEKTAWVLINFLTNAIKNSGENTQVHVKVVLEDQSVTFSVEDHGRGIAPEYQQRIFDRFYKVPGTGRTGTGLGLSISKEFIEAMGGRIGVESQPGQGSRFYFNLPAWA